MPPLFASGDAPSYERLMGRWSRRLAAPFLEFAAIGTPAAILDVGCGTGSLTLALAEAVPGAHITGIDVSPAFVDYARSRTSDRRLKFEQGDAVALPYADQAFDATLSLLVLNFIPAAPRAIREMVRVTRPGGVAAAAVWDFRGGLPHQRVFLDTAAAIDSRRGDELRAKVLATPLIGPGELAAAWREAGLRRVEQTELAIRLEFQSFADYWEPWTGGAGTVAPYIASLDQATKASIVDHLRRAYLAGGEDGPRSFAAIAWAVRGFAES
jgi:SAM-dependent methyltransferase